MESQASALIVAKPGQLRDSLQVLLAAISRIRKVIRLDDVPSALSTPGQRRPDLAPLDSDLAGDELQTATLRSKSEWPETRCIVLVGERQNLKARANVILIRGILASMFYATVEALLSRAET